jgi:aspartyl/asparaginyl beta-hydroxylase (cupin superfamily)
MINPIIKDLELKHNGIRSNVLFIKLKAGHNISAHSDSGEYLLSSRRHHIPIITSDQTFFTVGSEKINMSEGECWEINNSRVHSVENSSKIDRVHLLIDIMPNTEIGEE